MRAFVLSGLVLTSAWLVSPVAQAAVPSIPEFLFTRASPNQLTVAWEITNDGGKDVTGHTISWAELGGNSSGTATVRPFAIARDAKIRRRNGIELDSIDIQDLTSHEGVLYMLTYSGDEGGRLYTLDPDTGTTQRIDGFNVNERTPRSIASLDGQLYMIGESHSSLYRLNPKTGEARIVGYLSTVTSTLYMASLTVHENELLGFNLASPDKIYMIGRGEGGRSLAMEGKPVHYSHRPPLVGLSLEKHKGVLYLSSVLPNNLFRVMVGSKTSTATRIIATRLHFASLASHQGLLYGVDSSSFVNRIVTPQSASYRIPNLKVGTKYEIEATAVNSDGTSMAARDTFETLGMPTMPLNLMAKPGDSEIGLTWEKPASDGGSALTSYTVSWTPPNLRDDSEVEDGLPASMTSHTITGLTNGQEYTITLSAQNTVGVGQPTRVSVTPATVPKTPLNLVAKPRNKKADVTWAVPTFNGGSVLTTYTMSWTPPNSEGASQVKFEASVLEHTITGLTNGEEYTITLLAENAVGVGQSTKVSVTPETVPSTPLNLVVAKARDGKIDLTWKPPTSNGGFALVEYQVFWEPQEGYLVKGDPPQDLPVINLRSSAVPASATEYTLAGLRNGVGYTIWVTAWNRFGEGPRSVPVSATPTPTVPPSIPRNVQAKRGNMAINLSWDEPASSGGLEVMRYHLRWQPAGGSISGVAVPAQAVKYTYTISGLTSGEEYTIWVSAQNTLGTGPSAQVSATPATMPTTPRNVVATPRNMEIGLTWNKPASDGGSALTTYKVSWNPSSRGGVSETTVSATMTKHTITGLTNGEEYTIWVLAENVINMGPSAQVSATPATVPSTPQNVVAEGGEGVVYLTWEAPASNGGSALTTYRVSWETENEGGSRLKIRSTDIVPATMTKYTITNLVNWNADTDAGKLKRIVHEIMLSAENEVGEGPPARVSSTSGIMPATPRNVVAVALDRAIRVTWDLPLTVPTTDFSQRRRNLEIDAVISLLSWGPASESLRDLSNAAGMMDLPVTPTGHTITGLMNGVEYAILVSAVNTFDEAGSSARVLSTPGVVPTTPRDVMAVALDTAIGLTWEAPASDGGSVLTGYKLSWQLADGSGSLSEVTVPAEPTAAVITGLTNDVRYEVSLLASNTVSEGPSIEVFSTPTAVFPELDIDIGRFALGAVSTAGRVIVPGNLASGGAIINPSALLQGGSPASGRVCIVSEESSEVADNCLMQEADTRAVPAFGSKLYGVSGTKWISQRIYVAPVIGFSHGTQRRSPDSEAVNLDLRLSSTAAETFKNTGGSGFEFDLNSMTHRLTEAAEVLPVEFTSVASTSIKLTRINGATFGGGAIDFGSDIEGLISAKRLFALGNSEVELLEPKEFSPPLIGGVVVDNMAQHSTELITFNKRTTITFTEAYAVKVRRYSTETTSLATDRSLSSTATKMVIDIAGSAPMITFDGSTPKGIAGSGSNIFEIILSSGEESTGISVLGGVPTPLSNADGAEGFTLATSGSVVPGFYAYETNTAAQASNPRITANTLNFRPLPGGRTVDDAARDFGVFDFIVSDFAPSGVATVVLRLNKEAGQREVGWQYHKYQQGFDGGEWSPFVRMGRDKIFSAPAPCPSAHADREPDEGGGGSYTWHLAHDGIRNKDRCLLLEIEDGSVNDADGRVNAIVSDPGTLAGKISGIGGIGGGGGMDLWWLILLLGGMALGTALTWRRSPRAGFLPRIDSGTHLLNGRLVDDPASWPIRVGPIPGTQTDSTDT